MTIENKSISTKNTIKDEKVSSMTIMDVLKSNTRLQIFFLLNIYKELSMTELAEILNISKSALHRHLKKLLESNIIEVSREEQVRGSILAKYYHISDKLPGTNESLDHKSLFQEEDISKKRNNLKTILEFEKSKFFVNKSINEYIKLSIEDSLNKISKKKSKLDLEVKETLDEYQQRFFLLSKNSHDQFCNSIDDLLNPTINHIPTKSSIKFVSNEPVEYIFVSTSVPIKKLLNFWKEGTTERVKRMERLEQLFK